MRDLATGRLWGGQELYMGYSPLDTWLQHFVNDAAVLKKVSSQQLEKATKGPIFSSVHTTPVSSLQVYSYRYTVCLPLTEYSTRMNSLQSWCLVRIDVVMDHVPNPLGSGRLSGEDVVQSATLALYIRAWPATKTKNIIGNDRYIRMSRVSSVVCSILFIYFSIFFV